jgi:hypothetical protein
MSATITVISVNAAAKTIEAVDMSLEAIFAHYDKFFACNFNNSMLLRYAKSTTVPSDPSNTIATSNQIFWRPNRMTIPMDAPHVLFMRYAWAPQDITSDADHMRTCTTEQMNRAEPTSFTEEEIRLLKSRIEFRT